MTLDQLPKCTVCKHPMTKQNHPRIDGAKVHRAHGHCHACYGVGWRAGKFKDIPKPQHTDTKILCKSCDEWKTYNFFDKCENNKIKRLYTCSLCRRLWELYRLKITEYTDMLQSQNNSCAICNVNFDLDIKPYVDHDHNCCTGLRSCGKCVRGLLCNACNFGLGNFKDKPESLVQAARYLKGYNDKTTN